MNKFIQNTLTILLCALTISACSDAQHKEAAAEIHLGNNATNEFAKPLPANAPVLHVSADATYPPFAFYDEHGNVMGLDADIIHAIAADQNMRVSIRHQPWETVFTGITSADNQNQIVVSAMAAEEGEGIALERSHTYLLSPNIILVRADSPIQTIQDLADKHIAIRAESVATEQLRQLGVQPSAVTENKGTYIGFKALARGEVDAVIDDNTVLSHHISDYPEVQFRVINFPNNREAESLVMAVAKDNTALLDKINAGLANIRANGTYDRILAKWGLDAKRATPPVAAQ